MIRGYDRPCEGLLPPGKHQALGKRGSKVGFRIRYMKYSVNVVHTWHALFHSGEEIKRIS